MSFASIPSITAQEIADRYDVVLLDSYGVLVHAGGPLPGAAAMLERLRRRGRAYFVVTNDASRLPGTSADRFVRFGLDVRAEQVITSGSLLAPYFAREGLGGARCMVLGPKDSRAYVAAAGGVVVPPDVAAGYDALVVCDDAGYPFLDTVDVAISALYRHFDRGDDVRLICPNPDLVYPKGENEYGFTSGGVALLLEAALRRRYPERDLAFARLGKPHPPMFEEALRRAGEGRAIMIGDQLETDVAGARRAGIDAALVTTGVTRTAALHPDAPCAPTYLLDRLQ